MQTITPLRAPTHLRRPSQAPARRALIPSVIAHSVAMACLACLAPAQAQDITWLGGAGSWSEARWSSGLISDGASIHARIDGGNVAASAVTLDRLARIGRLSLFGGDSLTIPANQTLELLDGGVGGAGTLRLDGRSGRASLVLAGTSNLIGGTTELQGQQAIIYGSQLVIGTSHVLRGNGLLGDPSIALLGSATNHGLVRAEGALGLSLGTDTGFSNGGTVELAAGSRLHVARGSFSGGLLRSAEGFGALGTSGNGSFRDLTLQGTFSLPGGSNLMMGGTAGAAAGGAAHLRMDGSTQRSALIVDGALTLRRSVVEMTGPQAIVYGGVLTLDESAVFVQRGQLGDASVAALAGVVNRGLIEVVPGGELGTFMAGGSFVNEGTVRVGSEGRLSLRNTVFSGGAVDGVLNGRLAGDTFRDTQWLGSLQVTGGDTVSTAGVITLGLGIDGQNRTVLLGSTGRAAMTVDHSTLAGNGTFMVSGPEAVVYGNQLNIGAGVTVEGAGGGHLGNPAIALLGGVRNDGLVQARAGDFTVALGGGRFDNATRVQVDSEGRFLLRNTAFSGGVVSGSGAAAIAGDSFADTRFQGSLRVRGGDTLSSSGTLTVDGTLSFEGMAGRAALVASMTTLAGGGRTRLLGPEAVVYGSGLIIAAGHRLDSAGGALGDGSVALLGSVQVQGLLRAEGAGLRMRTSGGGLVSGGRIEVAAGSVFNAPTELLRQTSAGASLQIDGLLNAAALEVEAGTLAGTGRVDAATELDAATLAPGATPGAAGSLSFGRLLSLDANSRLSLDLPDLALHDLIAADAAVSLGGTLALAFGPGAALGHSWTVITAAGGVTGTFSGIDPMGLDGWWVDVIYGSHDVTVTLSAVPEPGTGALLAAGLLTVGSLARRRLRAHPSSHLG